MKKAILILGTGRSGTSVLTGCIGLLGAYLGEELTEGSNLNEKGYFESKKIVQLNKKILEKNNVSWYFIDPENIKPIDINEEIIQNIKQAILEVYGSKEIIAIKDPRLCILIANYDKALSEMGYEIYYVRIHRDEFSTYKSLVNTASNLGGNKTINVIKKYDELLDYYLKNYLYHRIQFDDLIDDPEKTILTMTEYLPFMNYSENNLHKINQFVDSSLRHY